MINVILALLGYFSPLWRNKKPRPERAGADKRARRSQASSLLLGRRQRAAAQDGVVDLAQGSARVGAASVCHSPGVVPLEPSTRLPDAVILAVPILPVRH
jgi:hypothetical protein